MIPDVEVVLVDVKELPVEEAVGATGIVDPMATEGPRGIDEPRGTGLLTAVLVNVGVPDTLVRVGVARFSNLDVNGSFKVKKRRFVH